MKLTSNNTNSNHLMNRFSDRADVQKFLLQRNWFSKLRYRSLTTVAMLSLFSPLSQASQNVPEEALDCLIEPWVISEVGSASQGIVAELLADRGDVVYKGQPLATLESGVEMAEIQLAEARATMNSEISAREADLKLAKLQIDRFKDLHTKKIVSSQQRDEATARYRIASAALVQARENNELQQLELLRTQRQLEMRTMVSPFDGVVVSQETFPGEFIHDNPIMKVASLHPLRIEVVLPARLFGTIEPGDTANLYPELGDGNLPMVATVDVVDPLLDTRSGTFGVRLRLSNEDYGIPAGQRCRIAFDPQVAAASPVKTAAPQPRIDAGLFTQ